MGPNCCIDLFLAEKLGVSAQAVSKWENGSYPDGVLIPKIAEYFGVSISALYGASEEQVSIEQQVLDAMQQAAAGGTASETAMNILWAILLSAWSDNHSYFPRTQAAANAALASVFRGEDSCCFMNLNPAQEFFTMLREPNGGFSVAENAGQLISVFRVLGEPGCMEVLLFLIVGVCYLVSGVTELMIRYDYRKSADRLTLRAGISDLQAGARYLRTRRDILAVIAAALSVNFFVNPVWGNFLPYFIRTDLAGASDRMLKQLLTPELWSSVFSICMAVGSLAAAAVLGRHPQKNYCGPILRRCLLTLSFAVLILAAGYTVLTIRTAAINFFLVLLCLVGCSVSAILCRMSISVNTVLLLKVSPDQMGKVSGIMSTAASALTPLASVLAGVVLQSTGSAALLWVCAFFLLLTAVISFKGRNLAGI